MKTYPNVEIHARSTLSPQLQMELNERFQKEFGHVPYYWATPESYVLAWFNETLAGSLGLFARRITVGGEPVCVGGIGGVITHPEWRGQGIAKAMLATSATFFRTERHSDFGLLICREEVAPVYAKSGWHIVAGPTVFDQPGGKITYPKRTMILPCNKTHWPEGKIDLCGLPW